MSASSAQASEAKAETAAAPLAPGQATRLVATSFFALFAIVGLVLYGLPFFYDFFVKELHWTRAQVTSGNMIGKLVVGPAFGFFAGWLVDRVGPRKPMIVGILIAAAALVGLGGVNALPFFYVFYLMNAVGYVFAGPLPNQVLLSRHFHEGRGRAMGLAYIGIGIGFSFVPRLAHVLEHELGWRTALRILGGIVVLVAMPLVLLLREGNTPAPRAPQGSRPPLNDVLNKVAFYLLVVGSMASIGAVGGGNQNLKLLLALDLKWTQADATTLIQVVAVVSLLGRFGAGWLADRIGPKKVMLLVYLLVTTAMVILAIGPRGNGMYAFAVIFGLGLGGEYLIIPLMAADLFGTAVLGRVMGIVLTADGVAEAVFPYIAGKLRDSTGSYTMSFQLLTALAAVGAVAIMLLPRSRGRVAGVTVTH
jgi:MFS family permease